MADLKISQLTAISVLTPATDVLPVVDVGGVTKKITTNQILGSGGTATLASATITGDLTAARLIVTGGTIPANGLWLPTTNTLEFAANSLAQYRIAPLGVFSWYDGAGGTRMTLNSNGLGVGYTPSGSADKIGSAATLGVVATGATADLNFRNSSLTAIQRIRYTDGTGVLTIGSATGTAYPVELGGSTSARAVTIDASSNVGIGVTPLYKFHAAVTSGAVGAFRATTAAIARLLVGNTVEDVELKVNANGDGQLTANASKYLGLGSGGLNDRVILDTTGNLLVGTTNTSATAGPGFKSQFSSTVPQFAIVVNEAGTSTSLSIYNVNAAAYRFYVNNGGTVFATNTTISAISDARLKENVQNLDVGLNEILALKPRKFDWKEGKGKDIKGDRGFIAQEFETVFPNLIDEWADPAPEGEAPYKSVRQDLIPVLVKAIQELTARVQTLEAR